jgi:ribosomal protein S17E
MENKEKNSNIFTITDPLLEHYYVQFDSSCYTAIKRVKSGTSDRVREQVLGYYTSLENCIDSIAEDSIKNQDYTSLQDFISAHKERLQELKQISIK